LAQALLAQGSRGDARGSPALAATSSLPPARARVADAAESVSFTMEGLGAARSEEQVPSPAEKTSSLTLPVPKRGHSVHWGEHVEDVREFTVEADPDRLVSICVESTPRGASSRASSRAGGFAGLSGSFGACAASPGSARSASTTAGLPGHFAICFGTPTGRTPAPSPCGSEAFWSALALPPIGADDETSPVDGQQPDDVVEDHGAVCLAVQATLSSSSSRPRALVMV